MKIEQINQKLKHKIWSLKTFVNAKADMNEDEDSEVKIQKLNFSNKIAIVQMSDEWMKFVLDGSSNTYLLKYDTILDTLMSKFERANDIDPSSLKSVATQFMQMEDIHNNVIGGMVEDVDLDEVRRYIVPKVNELVEELKDIASTLNASNHGIAPTAIGNSLSNALNMPFKPTGRLELDKTYVVVVNKTPFAVEAQNQIFHDMLVFKSLGDPLVWCGTRLTNEDGNIDDPDTPLGITA